MNNTITDLLEQLARLAGYVGHQGEAARDGVAVSPDHLIYLAKVMGLAVGQLRAAIEEQEAEPKRRRANSRQAELLDFVDLITDHISRMRLEDVSSFDSSSVYVRSKSGAHGGAAGLLEWFYTLDGPKTVGARVDNSHGYVHVRGLIGGREFRAWSSFGTPEAKAMIADCAAPSVHLLRRMQIAGAR